MKDSQLVVLAVWRCRKYIKVNNERFSTPRNAGVMADLSISR